MLKELLFSATPIPTLEKGLDAYSARHRAIASNVANNETVGYQRRTVEFEDKLRAALARGTLECTHPEHIPTRGVRPGGIDPKVGIDTRPGEANELNNVDIDREMADMAQNHLQFNIASKLTKHQFEMIQLSIKGI